MKLLRDDNAFDVVGMEWSTDCRSSTVLFRLSFPLVLFMI